MESPDDPCNSKGLACEIQLMQALAYSAKSWCSQM